MSPPTAPWSSSLGDFISSAYAMITPEIAPTNKNMIHVSKGKPQCVMRFGKHRLLRSIVIRSAEILSDFRSTQGRSHTS